MKGTKIDMSGKTCLVTGAGTPVGREIARNLAAMGAVVVVASNDFGEGEATRSSIVGKQPSAQLDIHTLDLTKRLSINDFIDAFGERHQRLDVIVFVINRSSRTKIESDYGVELTWMANVLGPYLLIHRLLDTLRASAPARVITVVSPYAGGLNLEDSDFDNRSYSGIKAYRQSMQAARLMMYGASSHLGIHGISFNACVPGVMRGDPGASIVAGLMARSPSAGAETPTWLASSPEVAGQTGKLWMNRAELKDKLREAGDIQHLWHILGMQALR
ncbi:MAG: SDR family NAD(P)-dependent oxidoreductase [Myxococcales bacterium]|nr:SDR family NAD(P)-dependent oxidoreductase [Myxococcales bacterium]MCB9704160.1 SDR family NAD(P)-dependent oxidoreductase [Myxococcales bacterium]